MDGGCLLLVIGSSGVDQGGVGGPGTPPSGQAHFYYNMSLLGASWGCGWRLPSASDWRLWR